MGIDIYTHWTGQTKASKHEQTAAWLTNCAGGAGYLREAYHGTPYATKFLVAEAFESGKAQIKAAVLRKRLPHTLALVEQRERKLYQSTDKEIEGVKDSFRAFVALCEKMERQTGEPVFVIASY